MCGRRPVRWWSLRDVRSRGDWSVLSAGSWSLGYGSVVEGIGEVVFSVRSRFKGKLIAVDLWEGAYPVPR